MYLQRGLIFLANENQSFVKINLHELTLILLKIYHFNIFCATEFIAVKLVSLVI